MSLFQDDAQEDSRSNTPLLSDEPIAASKELTIPEESPQSTPEPPPPAKSNKAGKKSKKMAIEEVEEVAVTEVAAVQNPAAASRDAVEEIKPSPKPEGGNKKAKKNKKEQGEENLLKALKHSEADVS